MVSERCILIAEQARRIPAHVAQALFELPASIAVAALDVSTDLPLHQCVGRTLLGNQPQVLVYLGQSQVVYVSASPSVGSGEL